jgi:surfactin synthase thioesterase subunit/phosphopantetheinyl transferase
VRHGSVGHPPGGSAVLLFCLPYAGGGASAYRQWSRALPGVDVRPVQLPGRESRIAEEARVDAGEIATEITAAVSAEAGSQARRFAIYGHSMGGRLGFEVVRRLAERGGPMPDRLYVAGSRPPDSGEPLADLADADDDELVARLEALGGTPAGVFDIPELRELLLPVLRADFGWLRDYRSRPGPVPVPIVALAGADDATVRPAQMLGWAAHTTADFRLRTVPGDHFFLTGSLARVAALLSGELTGRPATPDTLAPPAPDEVHLWYGSLDDGVDQLAIDGDGELSDREAARAARFRSDTDRRRYVARCALLRRLLRRYGADPGTRELRTGRHGKPSVTTTASGRDLRFSLAHSAGRLIVALRTGHEVGVDVERVRPMADLPTFVANALAPAEQERLAGVPKRERLALALRYWTAKEAVLKATGDGLQVEPDLICFDGRPGAAAWRPRVPAALSRLADWRVTHLDLGDAIGAVAAGGAPWRPRLDPIGALR